MSEEMKKTIYHILGVALVAVAAASCFKLDETPYDRVDKTNYYKDENSVKGAVAAAYAEPTKAIQYFYQLNEFSADQITWRVWNGGTWGWDEAMKFVLTSHTWTEESTIIRDAWNNTWTTIGLTNNIINDLSTIDPATLGMSQEKANSYIAEVRTLRAWSYYKLFEVWGGALPLNTGVSTEVPPSASPDFAEGCKIIFNFIAKELDETVDALPQNSINRMNQAMNRMLKARLLLNAKLFIGEDRFTECAGICQDIIDGKFGAYSLADDFREIFGKDNDKSQEIIYATALDINYSEFDAHNYRHMAYAYNSWDAFGFSTDASGWNCTCLVPSRDNSDGDGMTVGKGVSFLEAPYNDKLGAPFERLDNRDIRKQAYHCTEAGEWNGGMFLMGPQYVYGTTEPLLADADREGQNLIYVDQVGTFQNLGKNLETVMSARWGETNSGFRLVKYPIYPDAVGWDYRNTDEVEFRLAEAYYMLAECNLRGVATTKSAKDLVNDVRKRYFSSADRSAAIAIPGPGFTDFDLDWMLSEWGKEFIAEGQRRRTDLRRFDKFTQGKWWFFGRTDEGYPAQRNTKYEWFPLPAVALTVNPGLVQNPNYK